MNDNIITIQQLIDSGHNGYINFRNQIVVSDVKDVSLFRYPCRLQAVTILICLEGQLQGNVNLRRYRIEQNQVLINLPGNIIQIEEAHNLRACAVMISTDFLQSLSLDVFSRTRYVIELRKADRFSLPQQEVDALKHYLQLARHHFASADDNADLVKHIVSAFVINVMNLHQRYYEEAEAAATGHTKTNYIIFDRFLDLVEQYHCQEREVQFYASRLCISAKHLSKVVRDASGKRALDWINDYVVLEAKSMIKYSGYNIQEIARKMNFPTQSAFGKYFKKSTGLSPKEYMLGNLKG